MEQCILTISDIEIINDTIREMKHYKINTTISNIFEYLNKHFDGFIGTAAKAEAISRYLQFIDYKED